MSSYAIYPALANDGVDSVPLTVCLAAKDQSVLAQPISNNFDCGGRHGLFDIVLFVWSAGLGVLQQVVHPRQFNDSRVSVVFQRLVGSCEIFLSWHLHI